jgi:Sulfotransferase family
MPPNFFVIGSSRGGTTSLRHHLRAHPDVYVPSVAEPRFFAFEGDELRYTGPGDEMLRDRVITEPAAYQALFDGRTAESAVGEVSPAYLCSQTAAARIKEAAPDAKIIAVLRHPVERAISSFQRERLDGLETAPTLEDALVLEESRHRLGWSYVWRYRYRGLYYTHLARYFAAFPPDQIKVLGYEAWADDRGRSLLREVFEFLGVDPDEGMPVRAVHLNSARAEQPSRNALRGGEPSEKLRAELLRFYRPEIEHLQTMADIDLSGWL